MSTFLLWEDRLFCKTRLNFFKGVLHFINYTYIGFVVDERFPTYINKIVFKIINIVNCYHIYLLYIDFV